VRASSSWRHNPAWRSHLLLGRLSHYGLRSGDVRPVHRAAPKVSVCIVGSAGGRVPVAACVRR
jgi:hypothetical protein